MIHQRADSDHADQDAGTTQKPAQQQIAEPVKLVFLNAVVINPVCFDQPSEAEWILYRAAESIHTVPYNRLWELLLSAMNHMSCK